MGRLTAASGVRVNGAHPFIDPGGYRAHMIFELAQSHYKLPGLYNSLLQHYQVNVADPSAVTPAPVLGKDFNFQFTYEHTAAAAAKRDSSYRYAMLPEEIDLSSSQQDLYPSGVTIPGLGTQGSMASVTIPASPVAWGVTIPRNARNRDNAVAFLERLLGPSGRTALTTNGPTPLPRARASRSDYQRLPGAPVLDERELRNSTVAATVEAQRLFAFFRCSQSFSFSQNISKISWSAISVCGTFTVNGFVYILKIVERHLDVHVAEVDPPEAFCHVQCLAVRMSNQIERCLVVEAFCLDHEDVALPPPDRVAEERRETRTLSGTRDHR